MEEFIRVESNEPTGELPNLSDLTGQLPERERTQILKKYWGTVLGKIAIGMDDHNKMVRYDDELRRKTDKALGIAMDEEEQGVQVGDNTINHIKQGTPSWMPAALGAAIPTIGLLGLLAWNALRDDDDNQPPPSENTDTITIIGIE